MSVTRAVWILDLCEFLMYVDESLAQLVPHYAELQGTQSLFLGSSWTETYRFNQNKDGREIFIDWLICEMLDQHFYITAPQHYRTLKYSQIAADLHNHFELETWVYRCFLVPRAYGDIYPVSVRRQGAWLYIEADIPTHQLRQHALSHTTSTRPAPQPLY